MSRPGSNGAAPHKTPSRIAGKAIHLHEVHEVAKHRRPEEIYPELEAAKKKGVATFDDLTTAVRDSTLRGVARDTKRKAALTYYGTVLREFEKAHGFLEDIYVSPTTGTYVGKSRPPRAPLFGRARTAVKAISQPGRWSDRMRASAKAIVAPRAREAEFHFYFDLSRAGPEAGVLLTRMQHLYVEAQGLLSGRELIDCVGRLYNSATDLVGVLEYDRRKTKRQSAGGVNGQLKTRGELLGLIGRDIDDLELRYLKTPARLIYLQGAIVGVGVATAVGLVGLLFGLDPTMLQVWLAGAIGGLLSVLQRLNDDKLEVSYDVGSPAIRLTGTFRPILGGFAGLLMLYVVLAGIVPLPVGTSAETIYLIVVAFAVGFLERSVPDIISKVDVPKGSGK